MVVHTNSRHTDAFRQLRKKTKIRPNTLVSEAVSLVARLDLSRQDIKVETNYAEGDTWHLVLHLGKPPKKPKVVEFHGTIEAFYQTF
jgi:hypothetical protein